MIQSIWNHFFPLLNHCYMIKCKIYDSISAESMFVMYFIGFACVRARAHVCACLFDGLFLCCKPLNLLKAQVSCANVIIHWCTQWATDLKSNYENATNFMCMCTVHVAIWNLINYLIRFIWICMYLYLLYFIPIWAVGTVSYSCNWNLLKSKPLYIKTFPGRFSEAFR